MFFTTKASKVQRKGWRRGPIEEVWERDPTLFSGGSRSGFVKGSEADIDCLQGSPEGVSEAN
jgi:hypothetical protein